MLQWQWIQYWPSCDVNVVRVSLCACLIGLWLKKTLSVVLQIPSKVENTTWLTSLRFRFVFYCILVLHIFVVLCLQCFDTNGWASGRASSLQKIEWRGVGVVICLERGADCLHMVQLIPLHPKTPSSLASFKSRLVLPCYYRLIQVALEKRPLNGCSSSCCCMCMLLTHSCFVLHTHTPV